LQELQCASERPNVSLGEVTREREGERREREREKGGKEDERDGRCVKEGREGKGRKGKERKAKESKAKQSKGRKGREGKGREGKGREGKGRKEGRKDGRKKETFMCLPSLSPFLLFPSFLHHLILLSARPG
jgi:hypothetical protein